MKRASLQVRRRTLAALMIGATAAAPVGAQAPSRAEPRAGGTLFTSRDAWLAAGFAGLTVAMFPLDRRLAHTLRDSSLQANRFLSRASKGVESVADPGAIVIGTAMYAVGRIGGWRDVADLGLHGTEAVVAAGAATTLLKGVLGRARPYISADANAHDFRFGRGFGDNRYESFPSGHTTVAFAAAAAVTSESRRWWPGATWIVAPAMYGGATLVGASRIYHDAHWASDVALGAAIGTFAGIKVVRYAHHHPDNRINRLMLPMSVGLRSDGRAALAWNRTF
jgi:membrane-associated phospholipid phosphatase